jgi:predicted aspartyl protease
MDGRLDHRGQPILDLRLAGGEVPLAVLVDTGFDGELLAYRSQLDAAGLHPVSQDLERVQLADGTVVTTLVVTIGVHWHDELRPAIVNVIGYDAPEGARAVLGCQLLRDSTLNINFPAGTVRITR